MHYLEDQSASVFLEVPLRVRDELCLIFSPFLLTAWYRLTAQGRFLRGLLHLVLSISH
jgi:hypothetical protein